MVEVLALFPGLSRQEGAREVALHQALIHDTIHCLQRQEVPVEALCNTDIRWQRVHSSAPRRSWLTTLNRTGFPCVIEEVSGAHIDPVEDLVAIGQFAEAVSADLLALTLWLAPTFTTVVESYVDMKDRGPLTWELVRLNKEHDKFSIHGEISVKQYTEYVVTSKEGRIRIEQEDELVSTINQGRFWFLVEECTLCGIDIEHLCSSLPDWTTYVEKHERKQGFGTHQFWN